MQCTECGIIDETVKEYKLNFGIMSGQKDLFKALVTKGMCRECVLGNATMLKSELEFMKECDDVPTSEIALDIFIDESLA